jgi:hypothetical protein
MTDPLVAYADYVLGPQWRLKARIRASMFPEQLALYDDPAQFKECHAARRGGKSDGMPKSSAMDALDAGLNEVVIIAAETLKKAHALHWANLHAVVRRHQLPFTPNGQALTWTNPQGGSIVFLGLNDSAKVEEIRGFKIRAFRLDESATVATHLPRLIESVLEPALGDLGGQATLYGTPSVTRAGPWFDIAEGDECAKWSHHHWDVRQNPHFRPAHGGGEAWLSSVLERNNWTWEHPTFQREYLGKFVDDPDRMVVEYKHSRDAVRELPKGYSLDWPHVAGVDVGYEDDFAVVVLTMSPHQPERRYILAAEHASRLTNDDMAAMLTRLVRRYRVSSVVCDPGGGGKQFYETFSRRYAAELGVNVRGAQKVAGSVVESVRWLNTELRCERLKVLLPDAQGLAAEWQTLPWKDEFRQEPHPGYANHMHDAARYALTETITWTAKEPPSILAEAEKLEAEVRRQLDAKARMSQQERTKGRWG